MKAITKIKREVASRRQREAESDQRLARYINEARDDDETWPAISDAMGMTRQGLHKFRARVGQ